MSALLAIGVLCVIASVILFIRLAASAPAAGDPAPTGAGVRLPWIALGIFLLGIMCLIATVLLESTG